MGSFHTDRIYVYRGLLGTTEYTGHALAAALTGIGITDPARVASLHYYKRADKTSSEGASAVPIPRISFEMKSKPVEAKTRKLMVQ